MMKSSISTILLALTTLSFVKEIESRRIVGGEQSAPKEFPYFVEMGGCGGSLIAPNVVLTAAHCGPQQGKQLLIGSYELGTKGDDQETAWCEEWIPHPRYQLDGSLINNDFALCRLDRNVYRDTSKVESFGINFDSDFLNHNDDLIVMGQGAIAEGEGGPGVLYDVVVPYIRNEICRTGEWYGNSVTSQMLCAGYEEGEKDSCQGDSGGPLIKRELRDGKYHDTQVGVVSWGSGCAEAYKPGVYARTSAAETWISNTLEQLESRQSESCEIEFEMEIETDELAYETSWTLKNSWNERIGYRKYLAKKNNNRDRMCLQPNHCYTFVINDEHGDATCFEQPCTPWSLSLRKNGQYSDEKFFEYSENFGDQLVKKFCVNDRGEHDESMIHTDAPTEGPTGQTCDSDIVEDIDEAADIQASCDENQDAFHVKFNIDKYGNELQWKLSRLENRRKSVVAGNYRCTDFPSYASVRAPANNEKYYCLDRSSEYIFEIFDTYGDGLEKDGSEDEDPGYKAYLNREEIFDGRYFNNYESNTFATNNAVAPDPIPAPTPAPTAAPTPVPTWPPTDATTLLECLENDEDTTIYNIRHTGRKGNPKEWTNKNCKWIGKNKGRCNKYKFHDKTTGLIIDIKGKDLCPESCGRKGVGVCSFLKWQ